MATKGYVSALGGLAKDAVIGAGKGFVGGLKGAMMSEAPGITGAYAFAKELRNRANAPKMSSGGSAPSPAAANKPSSSSPMAGGLGVTNDKSIVAVLRQGNIINLEQVSQLKQLNANVINQSKLLKFTVDDTKRKDQFAEEVAKEQALRDDRLLEAIKKIGGGFGAKGKAGPADEGKSGGLGGLIGDYGKELALGGLAVLFRKQIASVLARIVASPLTGMAVNAAIAGGTFLATIGSGLAAALRIILTTALRALVTNPIGLAALGLGELFKTSRNKEKEQTENAIKNNLPVAPMPTKTFRQEAKELREQADTKKGLERGELLEKAKQAENNIAQEELNVKDKDGNPVSPMSLFQRQKAWNEKYGKSHSQSGAPKVATPAAPPPVTPDDYLANLARAESGNNPNIPSKTSTALGLYQFLGDPKDKAGNPIRNKDGSIKEGTWKTTVRSMMAAGVLKKEDAEANYLDDKFRVDPVKAKQVAAYFTEQNRAGLKKNLGREPIQADLYMAHFMGLGGDASGATKFLKMQKENPGASAAAAFSTEADSNPEIFYADGKARKQPRTINQVYEIMGQRIAGNKSGIPAPNTNKPVTPQVVDPLPPPGAAAVDPNNTKRKKGGTGKASEPYGDYLRRRYPNLTFNAPNPTPFTADVSYFQGQAEKRQKEEEELNKLIKEKLQRETGLKLAEATPLEEMGGLADKNKTIKEYKDAIEKLNKEILQKREGVKHVVPKSTSNSGVDLPKFANMNMLTDFPYAKTTAMVGAFLPDGDSSAGVEVVKESNPLMTVVEKLLEMVYGQRSSSVKLDPSYVDNGLIDDMEKEFRARNVSPDFSGTKMKPDVVQVEDKKLAKQIAKANVGTGKAAAAVAKQTFVAASGKQLPTKLDPFKPNFRGNTEILAEANKQFLKELRSTFTGLARKGLKDALLPDGVGVSFKQATQDNLFRGQQLKIINDTTKKINAAAVDLLGKKYGPMFAPMLDKLSTSYFEVGSRLAGRQLFTRFGGLDDKETMGITGQVLGNIAAGKKQLAFEQVLFGMSGGRKSGIALNAESLFAKYGFEDSQQGISYFADVLGEKATQPFSKLMGADDRSKSIIRDPRTGKLVYADSGKEATKDDIKAGYGGRISKEPLLGPENEYLEVPGYKGSVAGTGGPRDDYTIYDENGKIIGRKAGGMTKSSVTGGSISAPASKAIVGGGTIKQILNADSKDISRNTVFGTTEAERIAGGDALRAKENTYVAAQVELLNRSIEQERELAKAGAKREYDAALKVAKSEEEANEETYKYEKTLTEIQNANADVNAKAVINKLDEGQKGSAGDGTAPAGLKVSGRRPGQLFDANVYDKDDKITGKDPMKEIGNFGFDILKLGVGSEMTKGISNPYIQTIANFAIQKGMNYAIDSIMGTGGDGGIFSKIGSMFSSSSSSSSYGGYGGGGGGGIFDWVTSLFKDGGLVSFPKGGPVRGKGTGTSDSIPAYVSNGEFVVNAKAAARNYALLNAINQSTLPKKNTSGSGTYEDSGGPGSQSDFVGELGLGSAQDRSFMRDIGIAINEMNPIAKAIAGALLPGFGIASFFSSRMAQKDLDASNVIGGQSQIMSQNKANFRAAEIRAQNENETEAQTAKDYGKTSWGKTGNVDQDIGQVSYADVISGITAAVDAAVAVTGADNSASDASPTGGEKGGENLAKGGLVTGKGSGTSDSIFSMLSNGEFVINAKATKANLALLNQINSSTSSGSVPKSEYERNLSIEPFKNTFKGFADGGLVTASTMNAVPRPTSRSPYILSPPTNNSSSENQNNSSNMIIGPKTSTRIDNSSVTNFYNQASGMIDSIRSVTPQVA